MREGEQRIKVIVPIPMDAVGVANRAEQLPADFMAHYWRVATNGYTDGDRRPADKCRA